MSYITFWEITLNIWVIKISQKKVPPTFLEATLLELWVTKKVLLPSAGLSLLNISQKKVTLTWSLFIVGYSRVIYPPGKIK